MKKFAAILAGASALAAFAAPASAAITWTDWTLATPSGATGTAGAVTVNYSGALTFANTTPSTDYYTGTSFPAAFKPSNTDLIGLDAGGTKTITFSQPVTNVYLALVSWNGQQSVTFDHAFTTVTPLSSCGYWGCGVLPAGGTSFTSGREIHGVLKFSGNISSLTFNDSNGEYWHGFTVGFDNVAGGVPEPATWLSMTLGFGLLGAALRRSGRKALRTA